MATSRAMLSMCTVTILLALVVSEPVLFEGDDDIFASLLSAQKALAAAPARRTLAVKDATSCAMDVSAGTADLLQVGLGMWNAVTLCKQTEPHGSVKANALQRNEIIACVADVGGVVSSLTNVGQYIIGALESCAGEVKLTDTCARNSLILTGSISAAAGTSTALSAGCASIRSFKKITRGTIMNGASCIIDMRSSMQGLLKIIMSLVAIKQQCAITPEKCAASSAHVVASLANLAKFVVSAAGDCAGQLPPGAACGEDIASLVASLSTTASAATDVELACNPDAPTHPPPAVAVVVQPGGRYGSSVQMPIGTMTAHQAEVVAQIKANLTNFQRLYQHSSEEALDVDNQNDSPFSTTAVLAGFIPLMVIGGFLAGKRHGNFHSGGAAE